MYGTPQANFRVHWTGVAADVPVNAHVVLLPMEQTVYTFVILVHVLLYCVSGGGDHLYKIINMNFLYRGSRGLESTEEHNGN